MRAADVSQAHVDFQLPHTILERVDLLARVRTESIDRGIDAVDGAEKLRELRLRCGVRHGSGC